jgi:hypothetical protein
MTVQGSQHHSWRTSTRGEVASGTSSLSERAPNLCIFHSLLPVPCEFGRQADKIDGAIRLQKSCCRLSLTAPTTHPDRFFTPDNGLVLGQGQGSAIHFDV